MLTTLLHVQTAASTVAPRPKAAAAGVAVLPVCAGTAVAYGTAPKAVVGNGTTGSWLAISRLSMTVPAFHDRRPLRSTT